MELVPRDHGWSGLRRFAALAAALFAVSTIAMLTVLATTGREFRTVDAIVTAWLFAGLPLCLAVIAGKCGASRRLAVAGTTLLAAFFLFMLLMALPSLLAAPRLVLGGAARGSIADISASHAAWAEVSPARVWTAHVGTGVYSTMKDGRRRTTSISAAPIVPEIPHDGQIELFLCDDRDDLVDPDTGTLAGTLAPATDLAGDAVRQLADQGVRVGPDPRCLQPTRLGWLPTLALRLLYTALFTAAVTLAAAWGLTRTALGR